MTSTLGAEPIGEATPCDSAFVSTAEPAEQAKQDLDEASGRPLRSNPEVSYRKMSIAGSRMIDRAVAASSRVHSAPRITATGTRDVLPLTSSAAPASSS